MGNHGHSARLGEKQHRGSASRGAFPGLSRGSRGEARLLCLPRSLRFIREGRGTAAAPGGFPAGRAGECAVRDGVTVSPATSSLPGPPPVPRATPTPHSSDGGEKLPSDPAFPEARQEQEATHAGPVGTALARGGSSVPSTHTCPEHGLYGKDSSQRR